MAHDNAPACDKNMRLFMTGPGTAIGREGGRNAVGGCVWFSCLGLVMVTPSVVVVYLIHGAPILTRCTWNTTGFGSGTLAAASTPGPPALRQGSQSG
jgi:hypothetical protein